MHELQLQAQEGPAWHFTATLTQNLNRGAVNSGRLTLAVEGTHNGKLQKLDWAQLRQQPDLLQMRHLVAHRGRRGRRNQRQISADIEARFSGKQG